MAYNTALKKSLPSSTPYFLFDKEKLKKKLFLHKTIEEKSNIKLVYSIKSLSHVKILKEISRHIKGFSVSSLFESNLVKHITNKQHTIHFISPGIKDNQWDTVSNTAHFVTFNSLEQFMRFKDKLKSKTSYGIRLNPEISFISDSRYNPCRKSSKLGVPLSDILEFLENSRYTKHLKGLHFHNNCDSHDLSELTKTFKKIEFYLGKHLKKFEWINLGGGYLFDDSDNIATFYHLIQYIKKRYEFKHIIIEPGSSIVRDTAYLVSSVIDIFKREEKNIAVLDTTTNHLPEVFEYQYKPNISESSTSGPHEYMLAGCSCLAGDIFGTYFFKRKLKIGSKITFNKVGSYSLVKANMFNGINLPDIYYLENNIQLKNIKNYTFNDYVNYCGG